ncbi:hypothetical protein [Jiella pelagia]|uniref:Uncharacterized protein n=1 Tax=Jiella pelagia TaxID=2986949 RepID=A0ABY7BX57_9HYPH|nr:hypothetical protein [Jiella pelagia]WAP67982.1 hypothetical protein OH818_21545 [Jiella pelagia]
MSLVEEAAIVLGAARLAEIGLEDEKQDGAGQDEERHADRSLVAPIGQIVRLGPEQADLAAVGRQIGGRGNRVASLETDVQDLAGRIDCQEFARVGHEPIDALADILRPLGQRRDDDAVSVGDEEQGAGGKQVAGREALPRTAPGRKPRHSIP